MLQQCTMYQCKVGVDMLNAIKSVLADISSIALHLSKVLDMQWICSLLFALTKG